MSRVSQRLSRVSERIAQACLRAGRPQDVTLLAVTKTRSLNQIRELYDAGHRTLGENRVAEAAEKQSVLPADIEWHMIGHVQSNKARACGAFSWVHSIDKLETARALAKGRGTPLQLLLEANTGGEDTKDGVRDLDGLRRLAESLAVLEGVTLRGLMTMAPFSSEEAVVRPCFEKLRRWRDVLSAEFPGQDWSTLSMGMSNDFEWAIAEGSTLVRIGTALFEDAR